MAYRFGIDWFMNKLDTYLKKHSLSDAAFAKAVSRSGTSVYRYRTGKRVPDPIAMVRIFIATRGCVRPDHFYSLPKIKGSTS
jgi:hypothetical protein